MISITKEDIYYFIIGVIFILLVVGISSIGIKNQFDDYKYIQKQYNALFYTDKALEVANKTDLYNAYGVSLCIFILSTITSIFITSIIYVLTGWIFLE